MTHDASDDVLVTTSRWMKLRWTALSVVFGASVAAMLWFESYGWQLSFVQEFIAKASSPSVSESLATRDRRIGQLERERDAGTASVNEMAQTLTEQAQAMSELIENTSRFSSMVNDLRSDMRELKTELSLIRSDNQKSVQKALGFALRGHVVTPAAIGERLKMTWIFFKLSPCEMPKPTVRMQDTAGSQFIIQDLSVVNRDGVGVSYPVDASMAQDITYTGLVPSGVGITPGWADVWVEVVYRDCPLAPKAVSPRVRTMIAAETVK